MTYVCRYREVTSFFEAKFRTRGLALITARMREAIIFGCEETMSEGGARGPYGPSTDMQAFRELFAKAKNIVALSGAGISAESGVPTFRSATRNDVKMCAVFPVQRSWGLLEDLPGSAAGHARVVCSQSLAGVGILPLPQGGDGQQASQPCSQGGPPLSKSVCS